MTSKPPASGSSKDNILRLSRGLPSDTSDASSLETLVKLSAFAADIASFEWGGEKSKYSSDTSFESADLSSLGGKKGLKIKSTTESEGEGKVDEESNIADFSAMSNKAGGK